MNRGKISVAINGFGRIGRTVARAWWENYRDVVDLAAINTSGSMEAEGWAHLLKYDSVYGRFPGLIRVKEPKNSNRTGSPTARTNSWFLRLISVPSSRPKEATHNALTGASIPGTAGMEAAMPM